MKTWLLPLVLAAFLLPLPPVHAQTSQAGAATYEPVSDKGGDVSMIGLPSPASAVTPPPMAPFDLIEMGIVDEDEVGLTFYLKVANLNGDVNEVSSPDAQFDLWAKLDGSRSRYDLTWYPDLPGPLAPGTGVQPVEARLCIMTEPEDGSADEGAFRFGFCLSEVDVDATMDFGTGTLSAYVTKDALMATPGGAAGTGPRLSIGSRLTEIYAMSQAYFLPPWTDRLPDEGSAQPYVFSTPAANSRIRLALDHGSAGAMESGNATSGGPSPSPSPGGHEIIAKAPVSTDVSVTPGQPTLVRLRLSNEATMKRLVNLTATLGKDVPADKWEAQIAPAVRVPAGESRVLNLIVNASASLQHRDRATVVVHGESLGFPDEIAAVRLHLIASVPPGPERQKLYLHAAAEPHPGLLDGPVCPILGCSEGAITWMNTLQEDPKGDLDEGVRMDPTIFSSGSSGVFRLAFALDAPTSEALILNATKPVEASIAFTTTREFAGQVGLELYTTNTFRNIGEGSISATIKSDAPVAVSFLPLADQARIEPEDGGLTVLVEVRTSLTGTGSGAFVTGLQLVPKSTEITVPFLPNPDAGRITLSAGPAFLSLSASSSGREEFLNPGRAKIFNATIVNEGIAADDAQLEVLYDNPHWMVDIFPGSRFHLAAGDSAKFALLVHAPADASEGDQLHILVNATSSSDDEVLSQISFTAIVTKSIDIPDERNLYEADEDSAEKVVRNQGHNTPGFEGILAILVLGCLGRAFRRPGSR